MNDRLSASYLLVVASVLLALWWLHLGTAGRVEVLTKRLQKRTGGDSSKVSPSASITEPPGAKPASNGVSGVLL